MILGCINNIWLIEPRTNLNPKEVCINSKWDSGTWSSRFVLSLFFFSFFPLCMLTSPSVSLCAQPLFLWMLYWPCTFLVPSVPAHRSWTGTAGLWLDPRGAWSFPVRPSAPSPADSGSNPLGCTLSCFSVKWNALQFNYEVNKQPLACYWNDSRTIMSLFVSVDFKTRRSW